MYSVGTGVEEKHTCDNGGGVASTFDILMIADNVDGERSSVLALDLEDVARLTRIDCTITYDETMARPANESVTTVELTMRPIDDCSNNFHISLIARVGRHDADMVRFHLQDGGGRSSLYASRLDGSIFEVKQP